MSPHEKAFAKALGARIAGFRKDHNMTQVQLGELLGATQQTLASWEVGRRRVPVALLPELAHALAVSVEDLIGTRTQPARRGPSPKLLQQMERIQRLPRPQQRFVMQLLDSVLQQAAR
jgi:transcriptional regulator with XRE-family HTH domain